VPAAFARTDGKFQYYRLQENGQKGGTQAMTAGTLLYNGGYAFQQSDGQVLPTRVEGAVCQHPQGIVQGLKDQLRVLRAVTKEVADRKGQPTQRLEHELVWELANVPAGTALIAAGDTLISAGENRLAAIDMTNRRVTWTTEVDAPARSLAVSDGRLFVSTVSGAVYCFGGDPSVPSAAPASRPIESRAPQLVAEVVDEIIRTSGITAGYCVDLGCGDGDLTCELIRRTDLYVVAIDADPAKVAATRRKLLDRGVYGARGMVHCGDPQATNYPKYFANLVVSGRSLDSGSADSNTKEALRLQRPYGGVVCMGPPGSMRVTTRGPLDKAGEWTHLYATAANVSCSTDDIHGPLHVLWFRDIDLAMPQRHGRGPAPLFSAGRVFVEGMDAILAVDAYNGLPLWRFELPKVLSAYNADHLAGTAVTGSNFCLEGDSLFVCYQDRCYRLDVATGKKLSTYTLPGTTADEPVTWGYVACEDGVLYGSLANREHIVRHAYLRADDFMKQQYSESKSFCAFDVATGAPLWRYDAAQSIRHNAIAIGGGRVFLIDRPLAAGDLLSRAPDDRRSKTAKPPEHALGKLLALDARSGKPVWNTSTDVYGTMLIYSAAHDLLLSCYQATRFKLPSEAGERMAVYRASTGELVWDREVKYQTRPLLNDRTIIAYPSAADLFSGESRPLDFVKSYGCGQIAGSKNLLLFRSATFGYYDLTRRSGTENFGGIRPGCWLNVLPVGGIVLSPDATTGCKCSYQNRAWMALEGSP
jgi:outer membrane protein assembly factor BamB